MVVAEAEFVHQVGPENADIVNQCLLGRSRRNMAVEVERRVEKKFIVPAKPAEPTRFGALDEIDARSELVLVGDVVVQREIVSHQGRAGLIGSGVILQKPDGDRVQARGGDDVAREGLVIAGGIGDGRAGQNL